MGFLSTVYFLQRGVEDCSGEAEMGSGRLNIDNMETALKMHVETSSAHKNTPLLQVFIHLKMAIFMVSASRSFPLPYDL